MLNPITYTENVIRDFLRYQLTTYPFTDPGLHKQMRHLLNLDESRRTPLLRGPYIKLSPAFAQGASIETLISEGVLHPGLRGIIPTEIEHVYGHQEKAIHAVHVGQHTVVSTGTGSGKTESFLYPIISRCLRLRDENAPAGIVAVIVYPMNALAEDQLGRLRDLLAGSGVTFGMYVGKTPEKEGAVIGTRLEAHASRDDYKAVVEQARDRRQAIYPPEERPSREELRASPPRILLTNVKQLELLLTRQIDVTLFDGAQLDYLVFDEAHTFSGAAGAETAALIRRLRAFCGRRADETICIATSATIVDPSGEPDAGRSFAARFFGVDPRQVALVTEEYDRRQVWAEQRTTPPPLPGSAALHLKNTLEALEEAEAETPSVSRERSENLPSQRGNVTKSSPPAPPKGGERGQIPPSGGIGGQSSARLLRSVFQAMTGQVLDTSRWRDSLYRHLAANEVVYHLVNLLAETPRTLPDLTTSLERLVGRPVSEEEILIWLALGAAARQEGRPLLRPVIHTFVRGVGGAVVTFPPMQPGPQLYLSAEAVPTAFQDQRLYPLPVSTCTTCGQHYFIHHLADFHFTGKEPEGGQQVGQQRLWRPLDAPNGGRRVVLLDKLVTGDDDEDDTPSRSAPVYLCRHCGTVHAASEEESSEPVRDRRPDAADAAGHGPTASEEGAACANCGRPGQLVPLYAVQSNENAPGYLSSCVACRARGGRRVGGYREPIRAVRAITVSDVHVLAQNMIQYAERRRLLIFADNRQDAAFQAGWMQDHARRFRLRVLMYEQMQGQSISVGDLAARLDRLLNDDNDLSRVLLPEVWREHPKEAAGLEHAAQRKYFLRIQVLREIVTGVRQRLGLEPWGRLRVDYLGLTPDLPFIRQWAARLGHEPGRLADGIAALLDNARRNAILLDRHGQLFTRFWHTSDREIQRGYLPLLPNVPRVLKLERGSNDHRSRVTQWLSSRGNTLAKQAARRWGVAKDDVETFLSELWDLLTGELALLVPVVVTGKRNRPVSGFQGGMQIDADRLRLTPTSGAERGLYRCQTCRRGHSRPTPNLACLGWQCRGSLVFEPESADDYDLRLLDQEFTMVRSREHSAQVPTADREVLERLFKGDAEQVNTLVCTPTLELGVDIGALDAVLLRNVPPLPANYWQRAGRAGRRHRMAVTLTYARPASHDQSYYRDPLRLLEGTIAPPRFNLRNELLVEKHIHAAVLTTLHQLRRSGGPLPVAEQANIGAVLKQCFPSRVKPYLFDEQGDVRPAPLDVSPLAQLIERHQSRLLADIQAIFAQHWPPEAAELVTPANLIRLLGETMARLTEVIQRLWRRLQWALDQMMRLEEERRRKGTLDPDEDALYRRCDRLVKRLKGISRRRSEAEGHDDTYTYGVLAAEGFLPGYGLDSGAVLATAQAPPNMPWLRDFDLPRAPAMALREYVPGNLIYANGHRFIPRFYHLLPDDPLLFRVDVEHQAVVEVGSGLDAIGPGLSAADLPAIPICDVDLPHQSHISDDEDYRFQLPVSIFGYEQGRHSGGQGYRWAEQTLLLRRGVHLRLVNVGAAGLLPTGRLGYPVCRVCGQSRSPLASDADQDRFAADHQERCGQPLQPLGFFADVVADALALIDCDGRQTAYSLLESLRLGAAQVLEMEAGDLQLLIIGQPGSERVNALLYDPMPGGSGLLEQLLERWAEVVQAALEIVRGCPAACDTACIDCLFTFRNAYYHRYLNRHTAAEKLAAWGQALTFSHDIPSNLPDAPAGDGEMAVNVAEDRLLALIQRAGLPQPQRQYPIDLGRPLGVTTPDCFYTDPNDIYEGICIYLDGMSAHLHGNAQTRQRDRQIREELRAREYKVIEIPYGDLTDPPAMANHFYQIGRVLLGRAQAAEIRERMVNDEG